VNRGKTGFPIVFIQATLAGGFRVAWRIDFPVASLWIG
jgi:hypothetical protein